MGTKWFRESDTFMPFTASSTMSPSSQIDRALNGAEPVCHALVLRGAHTGFNIVDDGVRIFVRGLSLVTIAQSAPRSAIPPSAAVSLVAVAPPPKPTISLRG